MKKYLVALIAIVMFIPFSTQSNTDTEKQVEQIGQSIERPPNSLSLAEMRYSRSIHTEILRNWTRPKDLKMNYDDYVMVKFKISQDGTIVSSEIEQSSGNNEFNTHALEILTRSAPFPDFPEEMNQNKFLELGIILRPPKN